MFGYVVINQPELKMKDYDTYRAYYCGVCHSLKERYGKKGQLTLSYDMTFLSILLNGLYESEIQDECHRCVMHPAGKHRMLFNEISDYAADMGILLSYFNLKDDWKDDRNVKSYALYKSIKKGERRVEKFYPRQAKAVRSYIHKLTECEQNVTRSIDAAAGLTGAMFAEIFVYHEDEWSEELRQMGFFLGKFIYLMDAYEDIDDDIRTGSYNPWKLYIGQPDFEEQVKQILTMMMSECAKAFERLPIVKDVEILRNIIFAGVWSKYETVKEKQEKETEKYDSRTV